MTLNGNTKIFLFVGNFLVVICNYWLARWSMHADTNTTHYFDSKIGYQNLKNTFIYDSDSFLVEYQSIRSFSVEIRFTYLDQPVGLVTNCVFQPMIDQPLAVCTSFIFFILSLL